MKSKKRLITAAVAVPALIAAIMLLPVPWFTVLIAAVSAATLAEFYIMYGLGRGLTVLGVLLALALVWTRHSGHFTEALAASFMALAAFRLFAGRGPEGAIKEAAPAMLGLAYIPVLMGFQIPLRQAGPEMIIFLYATVWCSDAAAYYAGGAFGKRKLFESVSPNKTWAGAVGSVAGGTATGAVLGLLLVKKLSPVEGAVAGLAVGVVTIIGDLVESMFKRDAGVKDSGSFIPGHGGLLDKLDGSLFAGPALLWLLTAMGVIGKWKLPF
jgi:phosphatidate cytidylyltransferase